MEGTRKTAILLLSLDQSLASEVMGKLPREKMEQVALAIANADHVTREEQEVVLNEFKAAFVTRPLIQPVGPDTARELLERTIDQTSVGPPEHRLDEQIEAGPFAFLHNRHSDDVRRIIEHEHPQTIAVVTAMLPPGMASQVLAGFSPPQQAEIVGRLARLGPTDATVLTEIATLLQMRSGRTPVRPRGVDHAADVLHETERTTSHSILNSLDQKDPGIAKTIRESLFSFQDLSGLSDETLETILLETTECPWAVALKGCSESLRQRLITCLPEKMGDALKSEMKSVGPLRLSEITAGQQQVAFAILGLEANGQIELPAPKVNRHKPNDRLPAAG
jgi:flagellar motor switch protein FliG